MSAEVLLSYEEDGILTLTLNRPEVMNSLNFELLQRLRDQVDRVRHRRDVRVIVVTGAGEKAFCSGADLKERAGLPPEKVKEFIFTIRNLFTAIEQLGMPVIAAVNGVALGGGTELALACDIRIAAATATLGLTETRLAIIPGAGGTQRLPRLIGRGKAKELIFTGRRVEA
ncbi:MAG TPA: enoyl-CoA hydratase-related protein, partial [Desulfobacterales bacterium]|nr:enoyl-CoA hydratase-related protein [Desulfobacterales bacterium]